jgi:hypothetical protein
VTIGTSPDVVPPPEPIVTAAPTTKRTRDFMAKQSLGFQARDDSGPQRAAPCPKPIGQEPPAALAGQSSGGLEGSMAASGT